MTPNKLETLYKKHNKILHKLESLKILEPGFCYVNEERDGFYYINSIEEGYLKVLHYNLSTMSISSESIEEEVLQKLPILPNPQKFIELFHTYEKLSIELFNRGLI